ncbi:hypothetical protein HK099_000670 [Clydaea vesicula]|uniref:G-protein coupled receptors family 1 profile domain-containing protein n=1 Tax=Clydaea vesicula TaxID=447962 RepID=A0AAD5TUH3_9FUNG|nr:hypothetical protein HK099_000670 [Clydaea vesicula]
MDRWECIVKQKPLTVKAISKILGAIYLLAVVMAIIPMFYNKYIEVYTLEPSETTCIVAWHSKNAWALVYIIGCILFILSTILAIVFVYYRLWRKISGLQKQKILVMESALLTSDLTDSSQVSSVVTSKNAQNRLQMKVLMLCVAMSATYVVGWGPYMSLIFYNLFTSRKVPYTVDLLATYCVVFVVILNPVILITFDVGTKSSLKKFFGMK